MLQLVTPTPEVLNHAERLMGEYSVSVWDALVLGACEECGIQRLLSEDLTHGHRYGNVEVLNPFRAVQEDQ